MKAEEFRRLTAELEKLTPHQKQLLTDRLRGSGHATDVRALIESRVGAAPVCPHCQHQQVSRWGKSSGLQRYRCGACHATFNALTGTPLARLRKKEQWLTYACQMTEGQSVRKSAAACDVHRNTAFRWRHRFLELPNSQRATLLSGIAEADETVFLESFKGKKRGLSRAPRKRGGKAAKRGLSEEQIPVLICRDRAGGTADFVLARAMGITHRPVNLAQRIRVIAGVYHVQNVNAYDSRLKTWMSRFHGVATCHLANYLGWRRLIERWGNAPKPRAVLLAALGISQAQQLTVT